MLVANDVFKNHPGVDADRKRRVLRIARQLEAIWPPPRTMRRPAKKTGYPKVDLDAPPDTEAPRAEVNGESSVLTDYLARSAAAAAPPVVRWPIVPSDPGPAAAPGTSLGRASPTTTEPASVGPGAGSSTKTGGRPPGEYIDTMRTVTWLRASRHGVRWLARQLGVSHAHMRSVLIGLTKLSESRCRKLEQILSVSVGAVS